MQKAIKRARSRIQPADDSAATAARGGAEAVAQGVGGAVAAINQATISSATFTMTPAGTGVATFEFRQLQPQAKAPPRRLPPLTDGSKANKGQRALTSISGGDDGAQKKHHMLLTAVCRGMFKALLSLLTIAAVTMLGNVVFAALEADTETESRETYRAEMLAFKAKYNLTEEDFDWVVGQVGTAVDFDKDGRERNWGTTNTNSVLFVFTVVSTIGYGNFAPATDGGKVFLMVFALVGIPIIGTAVGILAAVVLNGLEFIAVMHMDELELAFKHFDSDDSGFLDLEEFREALELMDVEDLSLPDGRPAPRFEELVAQVDDGSGQIDLREFKICASKLNLPVGRAARTRIRLYISVATALAWMVMGMFVYVETEVAQKWSHLDSLYFCVVTLTTIGLGDLVPASSAGVAFHYIYCVVGLGLIALLLTAVGEFATASADAARKRAYDLVTEKRVTVQSSDVALVRALNGHVLTVVGRDTIDDVKERLCKLCAEGGGGGGAAAAVITAGSLQLEHHECGVLRSELKEGCWGDGLAAISDFRIHNGDTITVTTVGAAASARSVAAAAAAAGVPALPLSRMASESGGGGSAGTSRSTPRSTPRSERLQRSKTGSVGLMSQASGRRKP